MKIITLRYCVVEWADWGCVTYFPDGTKVGATPHDTHHYHVIAHRTGYGDDVMAYCREHEVIHSLLEERLHDRPSRVLWALAHGESIPDEDAAYEESLVQMFQAWLRANQRPIVGGIPWDDLEADALAVLD